MQISSYETCNESEMNLFINAVHVVFVACSSAIWGKNLLEDDSKPLSRVMVTPYALTIPRDRPNQ